MKEPWLWNEDDLQELIDRGEQESFELEFKVCAALGRGDSKKDEVSKDISAFANSAGGTIVYGIIERDHRAAGIDVGYDPDDLSKEWLDQVISSRIHRRIDGIRIKPVELSRSSPGKVAYVVFVPESVRAPHQAADKRFYKRYNFESKPMEEYEIRDVSRRTEAPDLQIMLGLVVGNDNLPPTTRGQSTHLALSVNIRNESAATAEYAVISIFIDSRLDLPRGGCGMTLLEELTLSTKAGHVRVKQLSLNHGIPGSMPLFKGPKFALLQAPVAIGVYETGQYVIAWQVMAPGMAAVSEQLLLDWDGSLPRLLPFEAENG